MKTDWVAEMFSALRDCGEDISIVYGEQTSASGHGEPRWIELPHDRYDGISGLAALLRLQRLRVEHLPELRGDRFGALRGLRGFLSILPAIKVRRQQWASPFHWTRSVRFLPPGQRVAWRVLTEEQTRAIVAAAKAAGVTVNTYLLFHLDGAVSAELVAQGASRRWMIPVNLRGAVTRPAVEPPHMSFLGVDLERKPSLQAMQALVDRYRQRGYHWGMWIMLHMGRLLGAEGMRRDIRKREKQQHGTTGMFSNLGAWEVEGAADWMFCPAVTRVYPVGAGCLTLNGRMALTVQLHDALGRSVQTADALLQGWAGSCLVDAGAAPRSTEASRAGERERVVNA